MDSVFQANIFFFIASIATVVFAILVSIILWHISRVAKNIHVASQAIQEEMSTMVSHVTGIREHIEDVLFSIKDFIIKKTSTSQTTKKKSTNKNNN